MKNSMLAHIIKAVFKILWRLILHTTYFLGRALEWVLIEFNDFLRRQL